MSGIWRLHRRRALGRDRLHRRRTARSRSGFQFSNGLFRNKDMCLFKLTHWVRVASVSGMPSPRVVTFSLVGAVALAVATNGCKDPNPTFHFDAATDGPKDAAGEGAGSADGSGGAGADGGGGASGGGGG